MIRHLSPPPPIRSLPYGDPREERASNWITPWDFREPIDLGIIGAPLSKGGAVFCGTDAAPAAIRKAFADYGTYSSEFSFDLRELKVRDLGDIRMYPTDLARCHSNIQEALDDLLALGQDFFPLLVGGDQSISIPAIRSFCKRRSGPVGIIHFDAMSDLSSLTWGGPHSGSAMRAILEGDLPIKGSNVAQIGLRSFGGSADTYRYSREQGITLFSAREVRLHGIREVAEQAIQVAAKGTEAIYVTVDICVLDPAYAPGVAVPYPGGLSSPELLETLYLLGEHPRVGALDLVGIDAILDVKELTVRMGCVLILTFLAGYHRRLQSSKLDVLR